MNTTSHAFEVSHADCTIINIIKFVRYASNECGVAK